MNFFTVEKNRAYIYRILTVVVPLLTFYGFISEDAVSLWLALGAAVLSVAGPGLAARNTSTNRDTDASGGY